MKALVRWLLSPMFWCLAPVMEWASKGANCSFEYGVAGNTIVYFEFTDVAGVRYTWTKDPESTREMAWALIRAADGIEEAAAYD